MKKLLQLMTLSLLITLFVSINTYAMEGDNRLSPEQRLDGKIMEGTEKRAMQTAEMTANFEDFAATREENQNRRLEIVLRYAPDLYSAYEAAFESHNVVHIALFNAHQDILKGFMTDSKDVLDAKKAELLDEMATGDMTLTEVKEVLLATRISLKSDMDDFKTSYETAIYEITAAEEISKTERKELVETLKNAITSSDYEAANVALTSLYDLLLNHIALDQSKLEILGSMDKPFK